jgi:hypothetical protein
MLTISYQLQYMVKVRKYGANNAFMVAHEWTRFKDYTTLNEAQSDAKRLFKNKNEPCRVMKTYILNIKKQVEIKDE